MASDSTKQSAVLDGCDIVYPDGVILARGADEDNCWKRKSLSRGSKMWSMSSAYKSHDDRVDMMESDDLRVWACTAENDLFIFMVFHLCNIRVRTEHKTFKES